MNGVTNGAASKERHVPGLAPTEPEKEKKSRNRKKKEKAEKAASPAVGKTEPPAVSASAPPPPPPVAAVEASGASPEDHKKQRALLKKLRAIDELKLRQASGETLEKTQLQKIEKEDEIVAELAKLGFTE